MILINRLIAIYLSLILPMIGDDNRFARLKADTQNPKLTSLPPNLDKYCNAVGITMPF